MENNRYDAFTSLILSISRNIQKIKNLEMSDLGLKGNHVQCIFHLNSSEEGKTATELATLCDEDKAAISRTLKDLEANGYVFVEKSNKKYKNPIKLTEKGKKTGEIVNQKIDNILKLAGKGIKKEERPKFYEQLQLVCDNLQNIIKSYGLKQ